MLPMLQAHLHNSATALPRFTLPGRRGRATVLYDDGDVGTAVDPRTTPVIFLLAPAPAAAAAGQGGEGSSGGPKRAREEEGSEGAPAQLRHRQLSARRERSASPGLAVAAEGDPAAAAAAAAPAKSGGSVAVLVPVKVEAPAVSPTVERGQQPPQQQQQQPQQQQQQQPSPPLPTPSAVEAQGSRQSPVAATGGGQSAAAGVAALGAQVRERRLDQALGSLVAAAADMEDTDGLKRALASLALALDAQTGRALRVRRCWVGWPLVLAHAPCSASASRSGCASCCCTAALPPFRLLTAAGCAPMAPGRMWCGPGAGTARSSGARCSRRRC